MIKFKIKGRTQIDLNKSVEGITIEQRVELIMSAKEPIKDGAPLIYTDRKDGVLPDYDIRSDRFEFAIDAMDKVTKGRLAKRAEAMKPNENTAINTADGVPMAVNSTTT